MHEYSIVQSLVDSVVAAVGPRQDAAVRSVHVGIGDLAGVDFTLLATAYEVFRGGTLCEHAALTIDRIPTRWECPRCRAEMQLGGFARCAECNEPAHLVTGDEIVLQRIELEVA